MDRIVREAWSTLFRKFADHAEPAWEPFAVLTAEDLRSTLARMRPGACEFRLLPDALPHDLAQVLNAIELAGSWPCSLLQAIVCLIPKSQGCKPLDQRPISVMSTAYRLWGAASAAHLAPWQEKWIAGGQHAYRAGHCSADVYWTRCSQVCRCTGRR